MPILMTTAEISDLFRVSERVVYLWRQSGKLPAIKLPGRGYRYKRDVVLEILGEKTA